MNNQILINVRSFHVEQIEDTRKATGEFKFFQLLDSRDYYVCHFYLTSNNGFKISTQAPFEGEANGFVFTVNSNEYDQILPLSQLKVKDFFNSNSLPIFSENK